MHKNLGFWHLLNDGRSVLALLRGCPTLCDPMDCSLPGTSIYGILRARVLEWAALPFFRGSSWPGDQTWISCASCIAGRYFTAEPSGQDVAILGPHHKATGGWSWGAVAPLEGSMFSRSPLCPEGLVFSFPLLAITLKTFEFVILIKQWVGRTAGEYSCSSDNVLLGCSLFFCFHLKLFLFALGSIHKTWVQAS